VKETVVSIRLFVEGVVLKLTNDSIWSDLKRSVILEDSTGARLRTDFEVDHEMLITTLQLRPGAKLKPRLIDSKYFTFDSSRTFSDFVLQGLERRIIRLPVHARLEALNIKFENGSPEGSLCARYDGIFSDVEDRASNELLLKRRLTPSDTGLALQCSKGRLLVPAYLLLDRDRYDLELRPNPTVRSEAVPLSRVFDDSIRVALLPTERRITITPLDPSGSKFKPGDMPKLSIRHRVVEIKGNVKEERGSYSAVMVPGLSYEFSLSHKFFEYGPRKDAVGGEDGELKLRTVLSVDQYPIQLAANGPFIRGRLPDSVLCSSEGKKVVAAFSSMRIAVPKVFDLKPPIDLELRPGDTDCWRLAGRELKPNGPNRVSIERVLNRKAPFAFRIVAPKEIPALRLKASLMAEGSPSDWIDRQVTLNEPFTSNIPWPQRPLDADTVRIVLEKHTGIGVNGDQRWQSMTLDTAMRWNGIDEIQLEVHKLPPFRILYVDLTQDNIDRAVLLKTLNSQLSEIEQRTEVRDCFLWLSNGVDRSYGYFEKVRSVINDLTRFESLVQDFYNEVRKIVDGYKASCNVLQRVVPDYHFYLSQSTFKWIRADVQTLSKRLRDIGVTDDRVTFYVYSDQKVEKVLGSFRIVNLASTSK
jgi:hypothetical protein